MGGENPGPPYSWGKGEGREPWPLEHTYIHIYIYTYIHIYMLETHPVCMDALLLADVTWGGLKYYVNTTHKETDQNGAGSEPRILGSVGGHPDVNLN